MDFARTLIAVIPQVLGFLSVRDANRFVLTCHSAAKWSFIIPSACTPQEIAAIFLSDATPAAAALEIPGCREVKIERDTQSQLSGLCVVFNLYPTGIKLKFYDDWSFDAELLPAEDWQTVDAVDLYRFAEAVEWGDFDFSAFTVRNAQQILYRLLASLFPLLLDRALEFPRLDATDRRSLRNARQVLKKAGRC